LVVRRRRDTRGRLEAYLGVLNRNLAPDNIVPRPPAFAGKDGAEAAIFNPNGATRLEGTSICIGAMFDDSARWHEPGASLPDGSYALFRSGTERVELAADAVASRTIWYVLTDEELIASTSQRAIITLLGSFEMNRTVLPWQLSSGTLGLALGWDARLQQVRAGERVILDRARWRLTRSGGRTAPFNAAPPRGKAAHRARLSEAVETVCRRFSGHPARWTLPLSGGVDSRALLFYLHERPGLQTITWGMSGARDQDGNDAQIARALADVFGIPNRYFPTDFSKEPRERLIQRFLTAGEGRVAQISGYLDGFAVWKTLFDDGFDGIVRGDEPFGLAFVHSAVAARYRSRVTLLADYFDAAEIASFELPEQRVPAELERRPGETLPTYRDRLYQQYSIPTALAALTDLKAAYVEVANPLLAASVLECVADLPDELRTNKRLWREIVAAQLPEVPFASQMAVMAIEDFVTDRAVLTLMLDEMHGENAAGVLAPALRKKVCATLHAALDADYAPARRARIKPQLSRMLPQRVTVAMRSWRSVRIPLNPLIFAFRAFLVLRMSELLELDAATAPASLRRAVHL
jgi:hypothetical protein